MGYDDIDFSEQEEKNEEKQKFTDQICMNMESGEIFKVKHEDDGKKILLKLDEREKIL